MAPEAVPPVFFYGEVTGDSVNRLSQEIERRTAQFPGKAVKLFISSSGGLLSPAVAFWEFVKLRRISLDVTALGGVYSSALVILCAGETRRATSTSRFLLHPVSRAIQGRVTSEDLERERNFAVIDERRYVEIVAGVTGQLESQIRKLMRGETHLDAEGAKKLGLIHEVLKIGK